MLLAGCIVMIPVWNPIQYRYEFCICQLGEVTSGLVAYGIPQIHCWSLVALHFSIVDFSKPLPSSLAKSIWYY